MNAVKDWFLGRADVAHKEAEALAQQGHTASSETMKYNFYEKALTRGKEAVTLENCAKAIVDTEKPK